MEDWQVILYFVFMYLSEEMCIQEKENKWLFLQPEHIRDHNMLDKCS